MVQGIKVSHVEAGAKKRADTYAAFWREAINKTNTTAWQRLFNNPLWGGLQQLNKGDLLEAQTIAAGLAEDSAILWNSILNSSPEIERIPTLIGTIRADLDRAGIPEELRTQKDLLAYFTGNVLPLFPGDREAQAAAMDIGSRIDYEILYYTREIICKLRKLAGLPDFIYIETPKTTAQLKAIYNKLVAGGYIAQDTWRDFFRCFDSLAISAGRIYWKKRGKNKQPNKRAMCDFLLLFGVDKRQWAEYVRILFQEDISPAAVSYAHHTHPIKHKTLHSSCFEELKHIIE